jgi:hypothetical protein
VAAPSGGVGGGQPLKNSQKKRRRRRRLEGRPCGRRGLSGSTHISTHISRMHRGSTRMQPWIKERRYSHIARAVMRYCRLMVSLKA